MAGFEMKTKIAAPREVVFDLARSVDLHIDTASGTDEKVIAGRTSGLFEEGETVTWEGKHFGMRLQLTSRVSGIDFPNRFFSKMVKGNFRKLEHEHVFEIIPEGTLMTDRFYFESPYGVIGKLADKFVLASHLKKFLKTRNEKLKSIAETELWKTYLVPEKYL